MPQLHERFGVAQQNRARLIHRIRSHNASVALGQIEAAHFLRQIGAGIFVDFARNAAFGIFGTQDEITPREADVRRHLRAFGTARIFDDLNDDLLPRLKHVADAISIFCRFAVNAFDDIVKRQKAIFCIAEIDERRVQTRRDIRYDAPINIVAQKSASLRFYLIILKCLVVGYRNAHFFRASPINQNPASQKKLQIVTKKSQKTRVSCREPCSAALRHRSAQTQTHSFCARYYTICAESSCFFFRLFAHVFLRAWPPYRLRRYGLWSALRQTASAIDRPQQPATPAGDQYAFAAALCSRFAASIRAAFAPTAGIIASS